MKAAVYHRYGNPAEVLKVEEVTRPELGPHQILVKVIAATVNRTDEGIVTARYVVSRLYSGLFRPKKPISGTDFAGRVEAIGSSVTAFRVGEQVFGFDDEGLSSHAEYLTIRQDKAIAVIPEAISYKEAAASLEGFHYAYTFVKKLNIESGQKVLVNGATGAIGSAAVQLLNYYGTQITAVANTKNIELVKSLGAARVIDYTKEDFTELDETYDFVVDAVGKSSFPRCKHLLKPKGTYVSSELGPYASNIFLALTTKFSKGKRVIFPIPSDIKDSLHLVKRLIEEGKFRPVIDRVYSLENITDAYSYVQTGEKTGNVVIEMER